MITKKLAEITTLLCSSQSDAEKFDKGNSSAGTRVRKAAQMAAKALKELRKIVSEVKAERAQEKNQT